MIHIFRSQQVVNFDHIRRQRGKMKESLQCCGTFLQLIKATPHHAFIDTESRLHNRATVSKVLKAISSTPTTMLDRCIAWLNYVLSSVSMVVVESRIVSYLTVGKAQPDFLVLNFAQKIIRNLETYPLSESGSFQS